MERDKKFILEALLEIQDNCKSGAPYDICGAMCQKGYDLDMCRYHLDLMDDAGYLKGTYKMMGANVIVTGLTNLGHDYIEKVKSGSDENQSPSVQITYNIDRSVNFGDKNKLRDVSVSTGDNSQSKIEKSKNLTVDISKDENNDKPSLFKKIIGWVKRVFSWLKPN